MKTRKEILAKATDLDEEISATFYDSGTANRQRRVEIMNRRDMLLWVLDEGLEVIQEERTRRFYKENPLEDHDDQRV